MFEKQLFPKQEIVGNFIDFLDGINNAIVIISLGSCIIEKQSGKYRTIMRYNDKVKLLEGSITTTSSNVCILTGILKAVECIKKASEVYIVSGTPLGFHSRKSPNRALCEKIYLALTQKKCNAKLVEIFGESEVLKDYFNELQNYQ